MNKYAIVKIDGKQVKVQEGDLLVVNHQEKPVVAVLAYYNGKETVFGQPELTDVVVELSKLEDKLSKKIVFNRFKAKSRYKKKKGHRQIVSNLKVGRIYKKGDVLEEKPQKAAVKSENKVVTKPKEKVVVMEKPVSSEKPKAAKAKVIKPTKTVKETESKAKKPTVKAKK